MRLLVILVVCIALMIFATGIWALYIAFSPADKRTADEMIQIYTTPVESADAFTVSDVSTTTSIGGMDCTTITVVSEDAAPRFVVIFGDPVPRIGQQVKLLYIRYQHDFGGMMSFLTIARS